MLKLSLLVIVLSSIVLQVHLQDVKATGKEVEPSEKERLWKKWAEVNKDVVMKVKTEEKGYRDLVFKVNVDEISKHNANPKRTYDIGLNQFSLMTEEEFRQLMLTATPGIENLDVPNGNGNGNGRNLQVIPLAASLNWTALGKVTPIKNQGQCGSCWAFSTTAALESTYLINIGATLSLSQQQLVDCSTGYGNKGCSGGFYTNAFKYIIAKKIVHSLTYPYVAVNQNCSRTTTMSAYPMTKYGYWTTGDCNNMKTQLNSRPLSVAVDATGWSRYKNGTFACNVTTYINHAVLLAGYQADGTWIIKNSWGKTWGEFGYIRLPTGNSCNVCKYPAAALL